MCTELFYYTPRVDAFFLFNKTWVAKLTGLVWTMSETRCVKVYLLVSPHRTGVLSVQTQVHVPVASNNKPTETLQSVSV